MALSNLTTAINATMRAVVWQGDPYSVGVVDMPRPTIINNTDAIVRITRAGICGSDLHIYRGTQDGPSEPYIFGHEVGDAVVIPFNTAEGHSHTGLTTYMYGGYGTGALGGTQGWAALDFAGFQTGDTVAIFGAGPVGLMAVHAAIIRGASRVYAVDYVSDRLETARLLGAVSINFQDSDPVEQIMALEPNGVARSVDAVGYEQVDRNLTVQSDVIISNMVAVTTAGGGMGTVGVYAPGAQNSSTAPAAATIQDPISFSMSDFFFGEFTWDAGPSNPIELFPFLIQLVNSGRATPGSIVSNVISIEDAPETYRRFERHEIQNAVIAFD